MYLIFYNFRVNEDYPFLQYREFDGIPKYKYYINFVNQDNKNTFLRWFDNNPFGLTFKIKIAKMAEDLDQKYLSLNINEYGKLDYKIQWKEDDMISLSQISETYQIVDNLLAKINQENQENGLKIPIP